MLVSNKTEPFDTCKIALVSNSNKVNIYIYKSDYPDLKEFVPFTKGVNSYKYEFAHKWETFRVVSLRRGSWE